MTDIDDAVLEASDALCRLANVYTADGFGDQSDVLHRQAAKLELSRPKLQECWGGPLNGQAGRQQSFLQIITTLRPTCIIETGSYRGLTTKWLAEHYDGKIYSVEAVGRYFYQALENNKSRPNVQIAQSDSRRFLRDFEAEADVGTLPLIYLDAHWEKDLPLKEELAIIKEKFARFIVAIDDFQVPFDLGYHWDDYDLEGRLTIEYLEDAGMGDCSIGFPALPSNQESGARRGCCILGFHAKIEECDTLRVAALQDWLKLKPETMSRRNDLDAGRAQVAADQMSYPEQLNSIRRERNLLVAELDKREAVMSDLQKSLDERLAIIEALDGNLKSLQNGESDDVKALRSICAERLALIDQQAVVIADLKKTLDERYAVIKRLDADLKLAQSSAAELVASLQSDCEKRNAVIVDLRKTLDERYSVIRALDADLKLAHSDTNQQVAALKCQCDERNAVIVDLHKTLDARHTVIDGLDADLKAAWSSTAEQVGVLQRVCDERQAVIVDLQRTLEERLATIERLDLDLRTAHTNAAERELSLQNVCDERIGLIERLDGELQALRANAAELRREP